MYSPTALQETLAVELERERRLSARVLHFIEQTYDIEHDNVGRFLSVSLSGLEEYEVDLILSPVFTPRLTDQAIFAELLGQTSIPVTEWPGLIDQLVRRPTTAHLADDTGAHPVVLQEVTIRRYVERLRLDGDISESINTLINGAGSAVDRPQLKAIARRAVWGTPRRSEILESYLRAAFKHGTFSMSDALALLNTAEAIKPTDLKALLAWIPERKDALRSQIAIGAPPFFSQDIQELHGGDRDQRSGPDERMSVKESELAFICRLQEILSSNR